MRKQNQMLSAFMPRHEKEWEARLFIDEAIKSKVEYHLEAIAKALSGKDEIKLDYTTEDKPFIHTDHIEGDDGKWTTKSKKYRIEARMREFVFHGNKEIEIWLKVIDFWAGREVCFPCGGASFPNAKVKCTHEDEAVKGS